MVLVPNVGFKGPVPSLQIGIGDFIQHQLMLLLKVILELFMFLQDINLELLIFEQDYDLTV